MTVVWLVALLIPAVGAKAHIAGFTHTTLMRNPGTDAASYVAGEAAKWVGPLLVLALIGVLVTLVAARRGTAARADVWLALVLFVAGLLAPVNQVRIHTWLSLQKHVDFGAWFACIAVGVLLARVFAGLRNRVHVGAGVLVTALVVGPLCYVGASQASHMYGEWPDSSGLVSTMRPYVHKGSDEYLVENYDVPAYYLRESTNWQQWQDLIGKSYTDPETKKTLTGAPALQAAVQDRVYSIVVLDFTQTPTSTRPSSPPSRRPGTACTRSSRAPGPATARTRSTSLRASVRSDAGRREVGRGQPVEGRTVAGRHEKAGDVLTVRPSSGRAASAGRVRCGCAPPAARRSG